jgi:hypothetical protein
MFILAWFTKIIVTNIRINMKKALCISKVLTGVNIKVMVAWDVKISSLVPRYKCLKGILLLSNCRKQLSRTPPY